MTTTQERGEARRTAALLSIGTRFWSQGLESVCRVTAIDERALEFETLEGDLGLRTSVPFELVARHVTAGRWRLLDAVSAPTTTHEVGGVVPIDEQRRAASRASSPEAGRARWLSLAPSARPGEVPSLRSDHGVRRWL